MPRTSTLASVEIDVAEKSQRSAVLSPEEPFRILAMGNFSGGAGRNRRPIGIDGDNFDQVMGLIAPEIRVPCGGVEIPIRFREMDDFDPDRLLERLPLFQKLRDLRKRLADPVTFPAAAAELEPEAEPPDPRLAQMSGAELLNMITGEEAPRPAAEAPRSAWDRMLRDLVGKYGTAAPDPRQPEWISRTDEAIAGEMRALMHYPAFQALEAAWRGMYFLTRRLDTGEDLKLYLMDLPQEELTAGTGLADVARALEGDPLGVVAGLYGFTKSEESVLERMAALGQDANVPFVAGLAPDVVGMEEGFGGLRQSLKARWIGLALPRFLLRLPYGAKTRPTESFAFEEMTEAPEHERYLWGSPAIACAYLLGETFSRYGWKMRPGMVQDIEGLPAHVYTVEGAKELKPCAEVLLTESAAELLIERGFMPLASMKGSDRVRLVRFQSVAKPSAPLAGKWE